MTNKLSDIEMHDQLIRYCFSVKCIDCRFFAPDGECRWDELNPKSTEECYRFALREGLIEAPDDAEVNFIKVERNDEVEQTNDAVNHPNHYCKGGIECIDVIRAVLGDGFNAYCQGNVIKYIFRCFDKGGCEDLKKAAKYLDYMIKGCENNG